MHYFRLLIAFYKKQLGSHIQVFKPATSEEHWYGFDEAFFESDSTKAETIRDLRGYVRSGTVPKFKAFRAFLLRFKVAELVKN